MERLSRPIGVDAADWDRICSCAQLKICEECPKDILPDLTDIFRSIFELSCKDLEGSPLLDSVIDLMRPLYERAKLKKMRRLVRETKWEALRRARLPVSHARAWKRGSRVLAVRHHRYQLPVGQGGFHMGTLEALASDDALWPKSLGGDGVSSAGFTYVYDCGSIPIRGVVSEIQAIVKRRPSRCLDILFVSHFDRDHICGIPHLLDIRTGFKVDKVVMPYLDDLDRMIAFGRCASTAGEEESERFFTDLVVDPIETMRRFNPGQIVLQMPSDEEDEGGFRRARETDPLLPEGDDIIWEIDPSHLRTAVADEQQARGDVIVARSLDVQIFPSVIGGWYLKPYVKRSDTKDRDAFAAALEVLFRWPRGSCKIKLMDKHLRRLMVTEHRTEMSRVYAWAFGDKNKASLSLYSGPRDPKNAGAVVYNMPELPTSRIGWLGTGDADLKELAAIHNFQRYYRTELEWVSTFVLPHHGSIHNYDPNVAALDAELFVAAAQPIHKNWKHPAPEIVRAIKARGAKFRKVDSKSQSLFEEKMIVFWPSI